ncbi:hypothetical protein D9757_010509 [Collybiopsis confluens]|uniref:Uncharacterized protein n=1 Tax=Collybiopsis confluens TaxID=2823264 RepID=A0A8H5GPA4_9AGAR|nr:hypothetical protein D9757_010509 [Collybiopsis confluens]
MIPRYSNPPSTNPGPGPQDRHTIDEPCQCRPRRPPFQPSASLPRPNERLVWPLWPTPCIRTAIDLLVLPLTLPITPSRPFTDTVASFFWLPRIALPIIVSALLAKSNDHSFAFAVPRSSPQPSAASAAFPRSSDSDLFGHVLLLHYHGTTTLELDSPSQDAVLCLPLLLSLF